MRWNKIGKSITNQKSWNAWIPKSSKKIHTDDESRIALGKIETVLTERKYRLVWEEHEEVGKSKKRTIMIFWVDVIHGFWIYYVSFLSGCIPVFLAVAIYFAILYVVEKNKQKGI